MKLQVAAYENIPWQSKTTTNITLSSDLLTNLFHPGFAGMEPHL